MSDLVQNLRAMSRLEHDDLSLGDEAADEIERLRALADSEGTRAVEYLRRARRAEAGNDRLRSALEAMLTQFGMDEDEWSKPTFDRARLALEPPCGCRQGECESKAGLRCRMADEIGTVAQ